MSQMKARDQMKARVVMSRSAGYNGNIFVVDLTVDFS
jgi:hypothetical protein